MSKCFVLFALIGLCAVAGYSRPDPSPPKGVAMPPPSPPGEVRPAEEAPGEAEVINRKGIEAPSRPADTAEVHECNGVTWGVNVKVRRLVSSGRDVLDFHWRMKYTGPRPPLIILEPSLIDSWPKTTRVVVFAFPKGSKEGRGEIFETTEPGEGVANGWALHGEPRYWYLTVRKGETATGVMPLAVADIKQRLRARYPDEFSEKVPPKLYVEMTHQPDNRGWTYDLDAWTGTLHSSTLEVPDLQKW